MTEAGRPPARSFVGQVRARFGLYLKRRRIRGQLRRAVLRGEPVRVVLGAGGVGLQGWITTDIDTLNILDENDWERYFRRHPIDALLAEHVWEHLTDEQGLVAARHCLRFLKPGGYARVAVPDGFHPDPAYRGQVGPGGGGDGAVDHKVLYTYASLGTLFRRAGFAVNLLEYHDDQHRFVSREWDPRGGMISRSARFDPRNRAGQLAYTSIILDAVKPLS
jgi:predicted SAM-dependent methyltransferase